MNGISSTTEMKLKELVVKNRIYNETLLTIAKLLQDNNMMEYAVYKPNIFLEKRCHL